MAGVTGLVNTTQTVCSNERKREGEEADAESVGSEMYDCDDTHTENYFFESVHHLLRSNPE